MRRGKHADTPNPGNVTALNKPRRTRQPNGRPGVNLEADGRWHGYVSLGIHPITGKRVKKHVVARTKEAAARKMAEVENNAEDVMLQTGTKGMSTEMWLKHWVSLNHKNKAPNTAAQYEWAVRRWLIPSLGDIPLKKLNTTLIENRFDRLTSTSGDQATPATKDKALTTLKSSLSAAVKRGHIRTNPALHVVLEKREEETTQPLTREEASAFLDVVMAQPDAARWLIGINLGLRQGEVLGIKWQDLNLEAGTLKLQRQWARRSWRHGCKQPAVCTSMANKCPQRKENPRERQMKTGEESRTLSLDERVIDTLKKHRIRQMQTRMAAPTWADEDWVFTTQVGTPLDHRNDHRRFQQLLKLAGVEERQVHSLRHTFASFSVLAGVDSRVVRFTAGWRTDSMLNRYTHITDESTKVAAVAILDEMLGVGKAAGIIHEDVADSSGSGSDKDELAEKKAMLMQLLDAL